MKTYKYIVLAALVLGMVACTQDDVTSQAPGKDDPITIQSAGVAELISRDIYDGVIIGKFDEPVYMGVFIRKRIIFITMHFFYYRQYHMFLYIWHMNI